jgi:predicted nucleotidyltransferase
MFAHEKKALKHITEKLKKRFSNRIISVYAFGSRVRGDHGEWSDFDVLVVVKNREPQIEYEIISIFVDEETESGLFFSPVIKDIRAFEMEKKYHTPFYKNIMKEGVLF